MLITNSTELSSLQPFGHEDIIDVNINDVKVPDINILVEWIKDQTSLNSTIPPIRIRVTRDLITSDSLTELFRLLRFRATDGLWLVFPDSDNSDDLPQILVNKVASNVHHPVFISYESGPDTDISEPLFKNTIIENIRAHHLLMRSGQHNNITKDYEAAIQSVGGPVTDPIKLKALLRNTPSANSEQLQVHIPVEIIHTAVHENQEEQQQEIARVEEQQQVIELEVQREEQYEYNVFNGELIDYQKFNDDFLEHQEIHEIYKTLFRQELFANLPQAIKYCSTEAAAYLAEHPELVSFNLKAYQDARHPATPASNLPIGFILKKTAMDELVLDYNPELTQRQLPHPFTPQPVTVYVKKFLIYSDYVQFPQSISEQVDKFFPSSSGGRGNPNKAAREKLHNVFVKHNEERTLLLFDYLEGFDTTHPGFSEFLIKNYLDKLPLWEFLFVDDRFFEQLNAIRNFGPEQLACFKDFIADREDVRYDFNHAVTGFIYFWQKWSDLATKNNVALNTIIGCWQKPKAGIPNVFMERLLFILNNARNLEEQLAPINSQSQEIIKPTEQSRRYLVNLNNYEDYYASSLEEFKMVSEVMKNVYNPIITDAKSFNSEATVYSVDLKWILQHWNDKAISREDYFSYIYRYIGQQHKGVGVHAFKHSLEKWAVGYSEYLYSPQLVAASSLLFCAHDRFTDTIDLQDFFQTSDRAYGYRLLENLINPLLELFVGDTKLSDVEGFMIFKKIGQMNSAEVERIFQDHEFFKAHTLAQFDEFKKNYALKLLSSLKQNKIGTMKCIKNLCKPDNSSNSNSFIYALDTAEFLAKDSNVGIVYQNDLLLFSTLLTGATNRYFDGVNDNELLNEISEIREILQQSASQSLPNNITYFIQTLLAFEKSFTYKQFIDAAKEIRGLKEFDISKVSSLIKHHGFSSDFTPPVFSHDSHALKMMMVDMIMFIEHGLPPEDLSDQLADEHFLKRSKLATKNIVELKEELRTSWSSHPEKAALCSVQLPFMLNEYIGTLIVEAFPNDDDWSMMLKKEIPNLPFLKNPSDFDRANEMTNNLCAISENFNVLISDPHFNSDQKEKISLFQDIINQRYDYATFIHFLTTIRAINRSRQYLSLLKQYKDISQSLNNQERSKLLDFMDDCLERQLSTPHLIRFISLFKQDDPHFDALLDYCHQLYFNDQAQCPLFNWMMRDNPPHDLAELAVISSITRLNLIPNHRNRVQRLLEKIEQKSELKEFLGKFSEKEQEKAASILIILSNSLELTTDKLLKGKEIPYSLLASQLQSFSVDELKTISLLKTNIVTLATQLQLKKPETETEFNCNEWLANFEKYPYGQRDFKQQFEISQVERVINGLEDKTTGSEFSYAYRKQMLEAFLFVNRAGNDLPIYLGKSARELSNQEIQKLFTDIKTKQVMATADDFQRCLYALALIREAMYRSTGQFPYSTQMLIIIDSMMHEGDVIANINTGEGKSMIEMMRNSVLYLVSTRVTITTSSRDDAQRDLNIYKPFLSSLGIPCSDKPVCLASSDKPSTSETEPSPYLIKGVNIGTMPDLNLFFLKASADGIIIGSPDDIVSLIINESDDTILDNSTICRYATTSGEGLLREGHEWVYDAINDFIDSPIFYTQDRNKDEDLKLFIAHLKNYAVNNGKSTRIIVNLQSDQTKLLRWIESAIKVKAILKENQQYILTEPFQKKINGIYQTTRAAKLIMLDKKISTDQQFGEGMQGLLYARLNKIPPLNSFVIEPESKSIISANNKNIIDQHREKNGIIWGSSGTIGSSYEITTQYQKYGFEFSLIQPHKKPQVKKHQLFTANNETEQFDQIYQQLTANKPNKAIPPVLVMLKDIDATKRFEEFLASKDLTGRQRQRYTGQGDSEGVINQAALSNMITITTPALGRNTDIPYDKMMGMDVILGYVDSERMMNQGGGRTGRQGSVGNVYTIVNSEDLNGKTIEEYKQALSDKAEKIRTYNEELYTIFGTFLHHLNQNMPQFNRDHWSNFSKTIENTYHEQRNENKYERDAFLKQAINQFNAQFNTGINDTTFKITKFSSEAQKETPLFKKHVAIKDCVPADIIAYQFISSPEHTDQQNLDQMKKELQKHLNNLFNRAGKNEFHDLNNEFVLYLQLNPGAKSLVREVHQEFLTTFLKKKQSVIWQWLGFEGSLNQVLKDDRYLILMKGIMELYLNTPDQENTNASNSLNVVKDSIKTLLTEYTKSWFVNPIKKAEALELIRQIDNKNTFDDLVKLLNTSQTNIINQDVTTNQSMLRKIKPTNLFGSRFQTTLLRSLKLVSVVSYPNNTDLSDIKPPTFVDNQSVDKVNQRVVDGLAKEAAEFQTLFPKTMNKMKGRLNDLKSNDDLGTQSAPSPKT